jgi:hypothetical protein
MRPFQEFVDLPKAEIQRILGQALGYGLPFELVKTDSTFVTLRTCLPYTSLRKLPHREPYQEHVQLNSDYQLQRFVYYPEHGGTAVLKEALNQLSIFLELQRLGFLPLGLPPVAARSNTQTWYGYGAQWPGQLEAGFHPFYNHGTYRYARQLYQSHHAMHQYKAEYRHYWCYEFEPGKGVVPDSLVELSWDEVVAAAESEKIYTVTTEYSGKDGLSHSIVPSPFIPLD